MSDLNLTFEQRLSNAAKEDTTGLILAILEQVKKGNASAMSVLQKAFEAGRFQEEAQLKISPEQFKQIIKLAADRL